MAFHKPFQVPCHCRQHHNMTVLRCVQTVGARTLTGSVTSAGSIHVWGCSFHSDLNSFRFIFPRNAFHWDSVPFCQIIHFIVVQRFFYLKYISYKITHKNCTKQTLRLYDASRKKAHLSLPIDLERNPASTLKSHIPFSCGIHPP